MQTTNIPIIDHSRAFATLYDEYVEPSPNTRKKNGAAAPGTPSHAQPCSQTPFLLPPTTAMTTTTQTLNASCVRAAHSAGAKRAKRAAAPPPAELLPQQQKHTAA
eukprot:2810933-Pleurochrysis_carterae.AAC.1